jgi:cytochrome c
MASSLEFNKVAAAVLTACVIGSLSGVIAGIVVHEKPLKQAAYAPAVAEKPEAGAEKGGEPEGPQPVDKLLASVTPQQGAEVTKKCAPCHSFEKGGPNKVGPDLFGIMGDKIAEGRGYTYSDALKTKGAGGTWDVEKMNHWLWKPQAFAKGTKMTFAGLPKAEDRAAVIKYLETLK